MAKNLDPEWAEDSNLRYIETAKNVPQAPIETTPAPTGKDFKYIGKYTPRVDGKKIVTGAAPYIHDIKLRGMLTGKILRSPHAKADILSVDLSKARALPGVKAAIQLKEDRVSYFGDEVAAVAAADERTADEALKLITVKYRPLPYAVTEKKAREDSAPIVRKGPNVVPFNTYSRGDTEAGLKEADAVFKADYKTAVEIHHPAETHSSIARWNGGRLTVWDSTQAIHSVRDGLARALKMPAGRVRVIKQYVGGGFGSKLGLNMHTLAAALLAKAAKKPVKIILSRKDNSLCVGNRPSTFQSYQGGVKKDGTLTFLSLKNYTCGGLGRGDRSSEPVIDLYKCSNVSVKEYTIYTNTEASRPTRAPGHVQGTFGFEGFLDELAARIGMDPLELRLKNYTIKNRGGTGIPYSSKGLDQCYRLGAEAIGWNRRNTIPGEKTGKIRRGIGMASQIWWGSGVPGTEAEIKIHPDGSVEALCGTQDLGTGTRTYMATVTAETLGLTPVDITVKLGNTDYPWAPSSGGSLTTPSVAPALRDAAVQAAARLKSIAAGMLKADSEDIVLKDQKLMLRDDASRAVPFAQAARSLRHETSFYGTRKGMPRDYAYNSFGAHFVEAEVDVETGRIKVLKVVAAHDIGRVINKQTAESQVIGGITQGVSTALFEERLLDEATGTLVNSNLRDYKIATALDIPEIIPIFADIIDPRINNLGTKGLGEPPRIPIAGAIGNAVFNALGVHVREIPMTPARVLAALNHKENG